MAEKKSQSSSAVGYTGKVTVRVVGTKNKLKKQYKLKNMGYQPLFEYLSSCLLGNVDSAMCPIYAVAYNVTGDESNLNSATAISSRPVIKSSGVQTSQNTAELTFAFPNTILASNAGKINCFALYCSQYYTTFNTDNKKPSAVVMLSGSESIEVQSGENLVVVWDLSVENQNEQN